MQKIVVVGRNDAGKSTLLGEIYRGLTAKGYQPMVIGSGIQDEKPFLEKGIPSAYITIETPGTRRDLADNMERVMRNSLNKIEENNNLIQHAKHALSELNKVRSVLELGQIIQNDLPNPSKLPDTFLLEAVGIGDGYKSFDGKQVADILVTVVPAGIKSELLMENDNVLLDKADVIAVTKIDVTSKTVANSNVKLLQRIYRNKPIIPIVASEGIHTDLVVKEIINKMGDPVELLNKVTYNRKPKPIPAH